MERTVTCVIVPVYVQRLDAVEQPKREHGAIFSGLGYTPPRTIPQEADLQWAADVHNAGQKVAMLIGAGAKGAADEVIQVADLLGAGLAKALLGGDVWAVGYYGSPVLTLVEK